MTDKLYNPNEKKSKELIAKKIVYERKDDLDFLKALYKFSSSAIERYEYTIKENKLKEIMPNYNFEIKKYLQEEDAQDSRSCVTLEISIYNKEKLNTSSFKIYKQTSYSKNSDDILEEFYILVNNKKIYSSYGETAYEINTQIEEKTLEIKENNDISKEDIFAIMHYFEMY